MKHSFILIAFLAFILPLRAQNVSYEELEEYTTALSSRQMEANNLSYMEGGTKYEVSFSDISFKLNFHNQSATQTVYKKANGKEILYLTENIDLSKVIGITSDTLSYDLGVIKLYLKSGSTVNTELIEEGKVIRTLVSDYVEIFCPDNGTRSRLFGELFDLCTSIQLAKGMITKKEIVDQKKDWGITSKVFKERHPNSLFIMQVDRTLKRLEKEKADDAKMALVRAAAFIDSLADTYNIRIGMSEAAFVQKNPEVAAVFFTKKNLSVSDGGNYRSYYASGKKNPTPIGSVTFKYDKLTHYSYSHYYGSTAERRRTFLEYLKLARQNVPADSMNVFDEYFVLLHPTEGYLLYIKYSSASDSYSKNISMQFDFSFIKFN